MHIFREGCDAGVPSGICVMACAFEDVVCGFGRVIASGACGGVLFVPVLESLFYGTLFRGMFGDPSLAREGKVFHQVSCGFPVDEWGRCFWEDVVSHPVLLGDGVLQECIERLDCGMIEFVVAVPKLPSFAIDLSMNRLGELVL